MKRPGLQAISTLPGGTHPRQVIQRESLLIGGRVAGGGEQTQGCDEGDRNPAEGARDDVWHSPASLGADRLEAGPLHRCSAASLPG